MAIRPSSTLSSGVYYEKLQAQVADAPAEANYFIFSGDPGPFRPTKQGLAVNRPDFIAGQANANAYLLNNGAGSPKQDYLRKIYLWVDTVETAWSVSGDFSQAAGARTFYPKNMHQDDVQITGFVANQTEYDKLVHFVEHSHYTALHGAQFSNNWQDYVSFLMFRPYIAKGTPSGPTDTYRYWPRAGRIDYGVILNTIAAGHGRFQYARQFTLSAKVIDDRTDQNRDSLYTDLSGKIPYTQIFGDFSATTADMLTAGTTPAAPHHSRHR